MSTECNREVHKSLARMQEAWASGEGTPAVLCAYCESALFEERGQRPHIEHFAARKHQPDLTFSWENLFLSCTDDHHCGRYKDRPGSRYLAEDLIKPDQDAPEEYFSFHQSGKIQPRPGLNDRQQRRAQKTIDILGLNCPSLRERRKRVIQAFLPGDEDLEVLEKYSQAELRIHHSDELDEAVKHPYFTAVKTVLLQL